MSERPLTDAEVICEFMEPSPDPSKWDKDKRDDFDYAVLMWSSRKGWWSFSGYGSCGPVFEAITLTLDRLWEVEEKLLPEEWMAYVEALQHRMLLTWKSFDKISVDQLFQLMHATAEHKVRALAAVIWERNVR
jgi:hypothetical protein